MIKKIAMDINLEILLLIELGYIHFVVSMRQATTRQSTNLFDMLKYEKRLPIGIKMEFDKIFSNNETDDNVLA